MSRRVVNQTTSLDEAVAAIINRLPIANTVIWTLGDDATAAALLRQGRTARTVTATSETPPSYDCIVTAPTASPFTCLRECLCSHRARSAVLVSVTMLGTAQVQELIPDHLLELILFDKAIKMRSLKRMMWLTCGLGLPEQLNAYKSETEMLLSPQRQLQQRGNVLEQLRIDLWQEGGGDD